MKVFAFTGVLICGGVHASQFQNVQDVLQFVEIGLREASCGDDFVYMNDKQGGLYYVHPYFLDFFESEPFQKALKEENILQLPSLVKEYFLGKDELYGNIFFICQAVREQEQKNAEDGSCYYYCSLVLNEILLYALHQTDPKILQLLSSIPDVCSAIQQSAFNILFSSNITEQISPFWRSQIAPFLSNENVEHFQKCIAAAKGLSPKRFPVITHRMTLMQQMLDVREMNEVKLEGLRSNLSIELVPTEA